MSIDSSLPLTPLSGVRAGLDQAVAAVREGCLAGSQTPELAALVREARAVQAQAEFLVLAATREVDVSGSQVTDGALTPAAWLRQHTRMTPAESCAAARTARVLWSSALDATRAALASGEIDPGAARLIATAPDDAPDEAVRVIEPHLLEAARHNTVHEVAAILRRFREALDRDRAEEEAVRKHTRRGVSCATTIDGMLGGRFLLDPVTGSLLLTALDAAQPLSTGDRRTAAQRRADALGVVCRHFLGTADTPRTGGARPHVVVTNTRRHPAHRQGTGGSCRECGNGTPVAGLSPETAAALNQALAEALADEGPRLSWIGPVPDATAARVACDAAVTVVDIDPDGRVTGATRRRRFFTWSQKRAIIARDGDTCPWPWCDRPIRWSDGHHLVPDSDGGPTTVANGALPCEGHHVMVHEGGWTLVRLTDGRYLARHDRTGRVLGPEPRRRPRGAAPPPHRRE